MPRDKKRSPMQPQAYAATAADHLLLSEHTETSATADTPPAWDLCGDSANVSISPCFTTTVDH